MYLAFSFRAEETRRILVQTLFVIGLGGGVLVDVGGVLRAGAETGAEIGAEKGAVLAPSRCVAALFSSVPLGEVEVRTLPLAIRRITSLAALRPQCVAIISSKGLLGWFDCGDQSESTVWYLRDPVAVVCRLVFVDIAVAETPTVSRRGNAE
jgi:hypothetical protein